MIKSGGEQSPQLPGEHLRIRSNPKRIKLGVIILIDIYIADRVPEHNFRHFFIIDQNFFFFHLFIFNQILQRSILQLATDNTGIRIIQQYTIDWVLSANLIALLIDELAQGRAGVLTAIFHFFNWHAFDDFFLSISVNKLNLWDIKIFLDAFVLERRNNILKKHVKLGRRILRMFQKFLVGHFDPPGGLFRARFCH